MKIVIDIKDDDYKRIQDISDVFNSLTSRAYSAIRNGTPLPDGAEILTKEAYSDLCTRAADVPNFESEEYVNERLNNYNKLLKSGMLDCVKEKAEPCDDVPDTNAGDLISRQAALDVVQKWFDRIKLNGDICLDGLRSLSSVEPERKTRKWVEGKCNRCGTHAPFWAMASTYYCSEYCPKCGAKMEENDEIDD